MKKDWKIVGYDKNARGEEVVVRFPVTGSHKRYIKFFDKSFPRKNFFKKLRQFNGD